MLAALTLSLTTPPPTAIQNLESLPELWLSIILSNRTGSAWARSVTQDTSPLELPLAEDDASTNPQPSSDGDDSGLDMIANERSQQNQSPLDTPETESSSDSDDTGDEAQSRQSDSGINNQPGASPLDVPETPTAEPTSVEVIPTDTPVETPTQAPTVVPTEAPAEPTATPEPLPTEPAETEGEATTEPTVDNPTAVPTVVPTVIPTDTASETTSPDDMEEPTNRSADEAAALVDETPPDSSDTVQTLQLVTEVGTAPVNSWFTVESMLLSLLCLVLISINGLGVTALVVTLLYIRSRRDQSYPDRLTRMPTYVSAMRVLPRRQSYD